MSEPEDDQAGSPDIAALSVNPSENSKRTRRTYSQEEKIIGLLELDANGGNVHRTAKAIDVPAATLTGWVEERSSGKLQSAFFNTRREKRGDIAGKMENLLHTLVEAMGSKVEKASLSQTAVAAGILTDKIQKLRGLGLDPNPDSTICRLLGLNAAQLPQNLQLKAGDQIPASFLLDSDLRPFIDVTPEPQPSRTLPAELPEATPEYQPEPETQPNEEQSLLDALLDDDQDPSN